TNDTDHGQTPMRKSSPVYPAAMLLHTAAGQPIRAPSGAAEAIGPSGGRRADDRRCIPGRATVTDNITGAIGADKIIGYVGWVVVVVRDDSRAQRLETGGLPRTGECTGWRSPGRRSCAARVRGRRVAGPGCVGIVGSLVWTTAGYGLV